MSAIDIIRERAEDLLLTVARVKEHYGFLSPVEKETEQVAKALLLALDREQLHSINSCRCVTCEKYYEQLDALVEGASQCREVNRTRA